MFGVLEHGIAFDALEHFFRKRERFRIGHNIDAGEREQIDIDVSIDDIAGAADIKIPASERSIDFQLAWVADQRIGRAQQADEPRCSLAMEALDVIRNAKPRWVSGGWRCARDKWWRES